ncbi:hypothetical protein [Actinoplanes teichomyceticus]|uniref:Uncharacterized protein n=1 Tax=Actinoplanes teichomyceticus TaxID=1867 RepID=A0A561VMY3_ACTTI|nr:hypothetical protein [Actinoplanes teichomyceticus]TWG12963.1 hypothetical protein FHX34_105831 [Actinoplanes teichomyceticus]GIF16975.1 hypothetical protein Ate01nite_70070 [Actinoplanes teichomyceticus]
MSVNDVVEIAFDVPGWPPIKNEALSLLSANHQQHDRVRTLLEAAAIASQAVAWTVTDRVVGLDVTVRAPLGRPAGDATNYLGGIGDVLQDKSNPVNLDLSHLGPLQEVALYLDDRQITQVRYDVEPADSPSYSVRVVVLRSP